MKADLNEAFKYFPNVLGQREDVSHASTRLTERGWSAVPLLHEVYQKQIGDKSSPCRVLHNSLQWQKTTTTCKLQNLCLKAALYNIKDLRFTGSIRAASRLHDHH